MPPPKLIWTSSKLDLVELIYALQATEAINHGDADLKEIQEAFELIFKFKVDDLYRSFQDRTTQKYLVSASSQEQVPSDPQLENHYIFFQILTHTFAHNCNSTILEFSPVLPFSIPRYSLPRLFYHRFGMYPNSGFLSFIICHQCQ